MGLISSNVISTFCPVYQIKVEEQARQPMGLCVCPDYISSGKKKNMLFFMVHANAKD